jgi:hypothetical protein
LRVLAKTVRADDFEQILLTGIARAKAGDLGWARFIAEYLIGKPTQRLEHTGAGGGPIVVVNWDDDSSDTA